MTTPTAGLTLEQRALRVLAWSELRKKASEAYAEEKAALEALMEPGDSKRPSIGDSDPIGSVSLSKPLTRAGISDPHAFNRWCIEYHPEHARVTITIDPEAWPVGIDARDFDANAVALAMTEHPGFVDIQVTPSAQLVKKILDAAVDARATVDHLGEFVDGITLSRSRPVLSARVTAKGAPILHDAMAGDIGTGVTLAELTASGTA